MLLNLLLIIVFIIMIKVILTSNKRTLSLFEAIGLTMMKKRIIILGLTGLILLLGLLMGGMFSSLFGLLYMNKIFPDYSSYYFISLLKSVILECIIIAVILIILFIGYRQNWNESIIQGLNTINRITETQKYKFKKVDFYIIIMQAVCLFVIIASMNFAEMFHFQEKEIVYDLYSKQMDSALPVNGYRVVKDNRELFHFNDISTLKEYDKNITLQMKAETNQSSILIEKNNVDKYWQTYCTDDKSESTPEKRKIWEQVSTEADKYRTIDSVHFELLVLPQKDFLHFLQLKDIQNKALEDNHEKRCVLLIPDYSSAAAETSLQKGENILLGRIENNKGHSVFFKESFKAEEIIDAPKDSNTIQLVISEETAKNSKLILGYDQINVSVNPASPQSVQKEVEEKISLLMASVQGGMLDSSASRNQYNVLMDRFSSILSNSLILFCLCVICIYILMNNYIDWEKNKFEYGVLRSFGMSYSALQHKLFLKYSISILIASTVSIAFGNLAFPHGAMTLQQILIALVITFSITYLCRIIAYYRNRNKPICSMLNRS